MKEIHLSVIDLTTSNAPLTQNEWKKMEKMKNEQQNNKKQQKGRRKERKGEDEKTNKKHIEILYC